MTGFQEYTGLEIDFDACEFSGGFDTDERYSNVEIITKNATSNGTNSALAQTCAASVHAALEMGGFMFGTADATLTLNPGKFVGRGFYSGGNDFPVAGRDFQKPIVESPFFQKRSSGATTKAACAVFTPSPETLAPLGSLRASARGSSSSNSSNSSTRVKTSDDSGEGVGTVSTVIKQEAKGGSREDSNEDTDDSSSGLVT